ncbi:MAG: alpha/beta hydrolase [Paraglaciecola sp.]|nr:alpha/beta hydrolase [Paraglaciecola sp.]
MPSTHEFTNTTEDKAFSLNTSQKMQRLVLKLCCTALPSLGLKVALYHFTNTRKRRPYALMELPSQIKSNTLPFRNGHIVTHSWGSGDKIIYLVHGWESNSSLMKGFIGPLVNQGYKVIAFDMPAHGRSSRQPTHLRDFSATLEYVMSVFGKAFGILAHSFGATATVLLMHEKQHLLPKKLCLISPMKSLDSHLQVFNTVTGLSDPMMDKLLIRLKLHYALEAKHTDITQLIQDVSIPGLLIHDEHDSLIPIEVTYRLASVWNGSRIIKTQNLGHRKILKDPFVIRQVTNYMLEPS